jgi:hypothetical protein
VDGGLKQRDKKERDHCDDEAHNKQIGCLFSLPSKEMPQVKVDTKEDPRDE